LDLHEYKGRQGPTIGLNMNMKVDKGQRLDLDVWIIIESTEGYFVSMVMKFPIQWNVQFCYQLKRYYTFEERPIKIELSVFLFCMNKIEFYNDKKYQLH
jgi:hypothetical protein